MKSSYHAMMRWTKLIPHFIKVMLEALGTRLGTLYGVGIVSRYVEKSTIIRIEATKRILWYIKGTL